MDNSRKNISNDIKKENKPNQINTLQIKDNININRNESTFSKKEVEENSFDKIKTKKEDINNLTLQNLKNINPINNINTINTINKSNFLEKTYNVNFSPIVETNIINNNCSNDNNITNYLNNNYEYELNNNPINIINVNHLNILYPTNKNQNYIKKENYLRSNNIINNENDNFDYSIKNNIKKDTSEIPIINSSNKNNPLKKSQID